MLKKLQDSLWLIEIKLADFAVRGVCFETESHVVVWDTLSHPHDMTPILPLLHDKPLIIIYSHADWDHIWGTAGLPHESCSIIGQRLCQARFSADVPEKLQTMQQAEPGKWDAVELIPPTISFESYLSLNLGNVTLELHHLPGHSADCIVGFIPEWGVLLAGDTVETPLPVIYKDSPLDAWLNALKNWHKQPNLKTVIPAHGTIGGKEIIHQTMTYLQRLRDGLKIEFSEPLDEFYQQTHQANRMLISDSSKRVAK